MTFRERLKIIGYLLVGLFGLGAIAAIIEGRRRLRRKHGTASLRSSE